MLEFAKRGIPILPIHDSFVVHHGNESLLQIVMQKSFNLVLGGRVQMKTEVLSTGDRLSMYHQESPISHDIADLLQHTGPYADHERRLGEFFARIS